MVKIELTMEEEEMVRRKRLFTKEGELLIEKDKWNEIMKDCKNGKCRKHGFIEWWGFCELDQEEHSTIIGFSCPQCEFEYHGKYSERAIEVYLRGYY